MYPSSFPKVFPPIMNCRCDMQPFHLPKIGSKGFKRGLMAKARLGADLLPGFPSMKTISHSGTLGYHGVSVFRVETKNQTMVITLKTNVDSETPENVALSTIGKQIFVDWPFLQEAECSSISDDLFVYTIETKKGKTAVVKTPHTTSTYDRFIAASEIIEEKYSKRYGTIIGHIPFVAHVKKIQGMALLNDGSLVKDFGPSEVEIAVQTIITGGQYEEERYIAKPPPSLEEEFPLDSVVFLLTSKYYGSMGTIVNHDLAQSTLSVGVNIFSPDGSSIEPKFVKSIAIDSLSKDLYVPSHLIAKMLKVSSLALTKITSALLVVIHGTEQRVNLGLNLKFDNKNKKVLGYSRKTDAGWQFSSETIKLLKEYQRLFPEVLRVLSTRNQNEMYSDVDLFGANEAPKRMAQLKEWLKSIGSKQFVQVPIPTVALQKSVVETLEQRIDSYTASSVPTGKYTVVNGFPRKFVLKPSHSKFRLLDQKFGLGDRIVATLNQGIMPLGSKGTVIGIDGEFLEVLLDLPLMGGTDLDGRCSIGRGATIHRASCINLTNVQPPVDLNSVRQASAGTTRYQREERTPLYNAWDRGGPSNNVVIPPQRPGVYFTPRPTNSYTNNRVRPQQRPTQHASVTQDARSDYQQPRPYNSIQNAPAQQAPPGQAYYGRPRPTNGPKEYKLNIPGRSADVNAMTASLKNILHLSDDTPQVEDESKKGITPQTHSPLLFVTGSVAPAQQTETTRLALLSLLQVNVEDSESSDQVVHQESKGNSRRDKGKRNASANK